MRGMQTSSRRSTGRASAVHSMVDGVQSWPAGPGAEWSGDAGGVWKEKRSCSTGWQVVAGTNGTEWLDRQLAPCWAAPTPARSRHDSGSENHKDFADVGLRERRRELMASLPLRRERRERPGAGRGCTVDSVMVRLDCCEFRCFLTCTHAFMQSLRRGGGGGQVGGGRRRLVIPRHCQDRIDTL
jgi:hypothetical protein